MYPAAIAEQLRLRGSDVDAVTARAELRSLPDADVFAAALAERRAVVSENIGDFTSLAGAADQRGHAHYGLILVDPAKYPRGNKRTVGHMVTQLERLLHDHPGDDATSLRHWL
ncbi:MAG: hypothetical protein DLM63_11825 [Solirubrobacterales bacterium]|nr:MAG: hypothetical protein DLM63_11825 [Solirubrobacterales bacterium]